MKCKSILIVEDNDDIRETIEDVLKTEGYRVYSVCNGREAIRALKAIDGPTLIMLDMMMPLMNGWEFLEAQKSDARFANLPIVVISALPANAALSGKGTEPVPARGYIRKPIELDTLMEIVQVYCGTPDELSVAPGATPGLTAETKAAESLSSENPYPAA